MYDANCSVRNIVVSVSYRAKNRNTRYRHVDKMSCSLMFIW